MTESTEETLARVPASFDRQEMMRTLGVELTSVELGKVEMSLRHDDRFTQQHGFLHAGAVASVPDTACGYAVLSLVFRYRRAQAAERAQLRWLVYAGALIVVAFLAVTLAENFISPGAAANNLQNATSSGGAALIPVAIGVAVLRYRLYDIDRIISRTLAYAIVTGLLVGVYAGLVLLATEVLRVHTPVAVAAATLAAAALFTPPPRPCSPRYGGGCSAGWTGGSTGPGTTPT